MKRNLTVFLLFLIICVVLGGFGCRNPFIPRAESPYVVIVKPPTSGGTDTYGRVINFGWESGVSWDPDSIRYLWTQNIDTNGVYDPAFNLIADLNANPWRYEQLWNRWISYRAPGDSGRSTILGDDEILEINRTHVFAVQSKDFVGDYTRIYELGKNVRRFIVTSVAGPLLTVTEPFLGINKFIGTTMSPVSYDLPPGIPLNFVWMGDASNYGGEIVGYRYGWDIADIHDPSQWDIELTPGITSAPERTLYSGTHIFFVEAVDNAGINTISQIMISIIPFPMDRNLLWVDDLYSIDPQPPTYTVPGESNHDAFWTDICSRAEGFSAGQDVYDCIENGLQRPSLQMIGSYKNIIWVYSSSQYAWGDVVEFTPESMVGMGPTQELNYLPVFLAKGGHLWTLGRSDREGGLAAIFPQSVLFPASFRDDMNYGSGDTSGVYCMGYKDYCVKVVDKVSGTFHTPPDAPPEPRTLERDAMRYAYRDDIDAVTAIYPGLPGTLELWETVTQPGNFFDPNIRGFYYVEAYDPEHWMDWKMLSSQECFHPIYRMKARNSLSPLEDTPVALWITKYDDIVPDVESGVAVAAKSFHFGLPLWFFNRAAVDSIVDVVFDEWQIATP